MGERERIPNGIRFRDYDWSSSRHIPRALYWSLVLARRIRRWVMAAIYRCRWCGKPYEEYTADERGGG